MTLTQRKDYIANKQKYIELYMSIPVERPAPLTLKDYINAIKSKLFS